MREKKHFFEGEAMIFSLLGLQCAERLGESFETLIMLYHRVYQQPWGTKNGGNKKFKLWQATVLDRRSLGLKYTERLGEYLLKPFSLKKIIFPVSEISKYIF